jgi:sRNA-binding protein
VLTGLVTTGVLTGAEEAVVLLHVADVAGVLTTDGVDTSAVTAARRAKAETDRLQAEAKARMEAKARAASKTQASARAQPAPSGAKTKPAGHLSAKEFLEIAQRG